MVLALIRSQGQSSRHACIHNGMTAFLWPLRIALMHVLNGTDRVTRSNEAR